MRSLVRRWYFLSPLILQKLIWIPTNLALGVFGSMEIYGLENLRGLDTNVIFALNHASELDVFLLPAALPFFSKFSPMFYTSREKDFYVNSGWRRHFYGGSFFKAWGAYPVTPGLNDYGASLKNQLAILRDGGSICIFPEGGVTKDGNMRPAKGGVAHLSYASKLPIIPVRLGGTYKLRLTDFLFCRRKLSIAFGAPIWDVTQAPRIPPYDVFKNYAEGIMTQIKKLPVAPEAMSPLLVRPYPVQPTQS
jgi:1-acyl-sn-glycerol-3-phosphate acyltransferase